MKSRVELRLIFKLLKQYENQYSERITIEKWRKNTVAKRISKYYKDWINNFGIIQEVRITHRLYV